MALIVCAEKIIENEQEIRGEFFNEEHYDVIYDEDVDVYDENNELLFLLRKGVIPKEMSRLGLRSFLEAAKRTKNHNRGLASGRVDLEKMPSNVESLVDPGKYKSKVKYKNGRISKGRKANAVNSMVAGYYDHKIWGNIRTKFTRNKKKEWESAIPFIRCINELFKEYEPDIYQSQQNKIVNKEFLVEDTIFTTITINYNYKTAAHKDAGNMEGSYSAFTVCEEGEWEGSYLGYPEYKLAANVREGDLLIMNPHRYHGNTKMVGEGGRLSFVFYARKGLVM